MKHVVLFILVFICFQTFAQDNRIYVSGKVTSDSVAVENAHIINYSAKKGVVTDLKGSFEIPVKIGDTIVVSSIQYSQKILVVSANDITNNFIQVFVDPAINELEEVFVTEKEDFLLDKDTTQYTVDASTLKLPNAGKEVLTPTERKINYLKKGGAIDQLRNLITGEKKKLKKFLVEENGYATLQDIRADFGDDFFTNNLGISEKNIGPFLEYCANFKIVQLYRADEKFQVFDLMVKHKPEFLALQQTEN